MDDGLPLKKTLELRHMVIGVRFVFQQILPSSFFSRIFVYIVNNIKMLSYDGIDVSEGIDINKTTASLDVCNGCHGVLMMYMNFSNITSINIHGVDYRISNGIRKREAISLLQNADLNEKSGTL